MSRYQSVFRPESKLNTVLNKMGNIIILSVLWLLGSLPVITIGTSTTALYYAMVKVVRRDSGYVTREFFASYRSNLKNGIVMTLIFLIIGIVLYLDRKVMGQSETQFAAALTLLYTLITLVVIGIFLYVFPVMSRFTFGKREAVRLASIMVFRHLPVTILLIVVTIAGIAVVGLLPIPMVFIIPGVVCYAGSFLMEKILRKYMAEPVTEEDKEKWYYK